MTTLDLSLKNSILYEGCEAEEVAGRLNLLTPPSQAANTVGRNIEAWLTRQTQRDEIILTGGMAIWAYLIVFHAVVHKYRRVYYDDGRSGPILVAAHG